MSKAQGLEEVRIPVEVILGRKELSLREVSGLGPGSIVELDSFAGEPVLLRAAGTTIACGEVVVIDERFGIRVTEMKASGAGDAGR